LQCPNITFNSTSFSGWSKHETVISHTFAFGKKAIIQFSQVEVKNFLQINSFYKTDQPMAPGSFTINGMNFENLNVSDTLVSFDQSVNSPTESILVQISDVNLKNIEYFTNPKSLQEAPSVLRLGFVENPFTDVQIFMKNISVKKMSSNWNSLIEVSGKIANFNLTNVSVYDSIALYQFTILGGKFQSVFADFHNIEVRDSKNIQLLREDILHKDSRWTFTNISAHDLALTATSFLDFDKFSFGDGDLLMNGMNYSIIELGPISFFKVRIRKQVHFTLLLNNISFENIYCGIFLVPVVLVVRILSFF
jgi:hypothetical protein